MPRIHTTIWDLAEAIFIEAEAEGSTEEEVDALAAIALIDSLDRAILVEEQHEIDRKTPRAASRRRSVVAI